MDLIGGTDMNELIIYPSRKVFTYYKGGYPVYEEVSYEQMEDKNNEITFILDNHDTYYTFNTNLIHLIKTKYGE